MINGSVIAAVGNWVSSYFERKATEQQAAAQRAKDVQVSADNYDTTALRMMATTFKDEYLIGMITAPLILAWFDAERADAWVDFVQALPIWYQMLLGGIYASTFGLRWWFKREQTKTYKELIQSGSVHDRNSD